MMKEVKGLNNLGQFYLITAMVMAVALIGIITVTNYSQKASGSDLLDVKEELEIEGKKVLDYTTFNELNQQQRYNTLNEFTGDYILHRKSEQDLYFIFGNKGNLTVKGFQSSAKKINISSGTTHSVITQTEGELQTSINPNNAAEAILYIDENPYSFELNEGENFYFIVSQESNGGKTIVSG